MMASMTSFPAQAIRVRDSTLPLQRRRYALRECTLHCAPYGFRATWHHLVVSARIPRRLEDDPGALVRAADELQRVRDVVLPRLREYAARRRREKAAGVRTPRSVPPWYSWGWSAIAYCPDPTHHPSAPLATVVQGVFDRDAAGITVSHTASPVGSNGVGPAAPAHIAASTPTVPQRGGVPLPPKIAGGGSGAARSSSRSK